ncbi:MAG: TipAS antibiotic-recognition domain-containing protein [Candidatus Aminicenantes bacterium]|nr:TipAS antibiotic-recognition domain-containing protein [Candidatus Aminicenantes bacterium]
MSEQEKAGWAEKFFSPEELGQFAEIGRRFSPEEMQAYQKKWTDLLSETRENLDLSPDSPEARDLLRRWQELLAEGFAGHEGLLARIGQAYRQGAIPQEYSVIGPEVWAFIKKVQEAADSK